MTTRCTTRLATHDSATRWQLAARVVQALLALLFVGTALWKLVTPVAELAAAMPWMGEVAPGFLSLTAALDLLVGLGLGAGLLSRRASRLAVWAALGGAGLMVGAIAFHIARGEAADTPFNAVLLALSLYIARARRE